MQKEIGAVMGLYPTPVTIVGTVVDGRANFLPIAHVGIVEHHKFLISVDNSHEFSKKGINANQTVSVSLVNQQMLKAADYCGIAKGAQTDKSDVFAFHFDDVKGAPVLEDAPVCMTCRVIGQFEVDNFTNYILNPIHTYVQEECLNERGKIDYEKVKPVLFEFQSAKYLSTGPVIGDCWKYGKDFRTESDQIG